MISLRSPRPHEISAILQRAAQQEFTYADVGATQTGKTPAAFTRLHHRVALGSGQDAFADAACAMRRWAPFPGWVSVTPSGALAPNVDLVVVARTLGFVSTNVCRVIYVIDETNRFGFGYGTLPTHIECGEERFLIERDDHGRVFYDVYSFSRPRHPLAVAASPVARAFQRRFLRDSARAMQAATGGGAPDSLV